VNKSVSAAALYVAYRIVVPATGEIKFADTADLVTHSDTGRQLNIRTTAVNELAKQFVGVALDCIYPMKVVNVQGADTIVLNQGESTLAVGDQLVLVEEGAPLKDPYTRESLGRVESPIGQFEVTRSHERSPTPGSSGALKVGHLDAAALMMHTPATASPRHVDQPDRRGRRYVPYRDFGGAADRQFP
jgi:hypothetical protein